MTSVGQIIETQDDFLINVIDNNYTLELSSSMVSIRNLIMNKL